MYPWNVSKSRHKLFISYYHDDDEYYRNKFEELFRYLFINKSVRPGDINTDLNTEYIKRLIQLGYLSDCSVLVVLIGRNTYKRKHVDWEISAALDKRVGETYAGLIGLWLPNHPDFGQTQYKSELVPPRLIANMRSGYAKSYDWTENEGRISSWIEDAYQARSSRVDKMDNSLLQFSNNR